MTDLPFTPLPFDHARLIADMRRGDPEAMAEAYRMTFGSDFGRLVLLDHLQKCGVGRQLGDESLKYKAGMIDGAISLCVAAGYDQVSLAATVLTDQLEENPDGAAFFHPETPDDDDLDSLR